MSEKNRDWYQAIFIRHSRRKYSSTPIETDKLEQLDELIDELNRNTTGARIALVRTHDGSIFSGIRGGYGIIKGPPAYLAFIADPQSAGSYEGLGFIGEAAVLEATTLKLGTCWVSGTFDPQAAAGKLELAAQERLVAVSPLGYPQDSYTLTEKVMSGFAGSRKRKPLQQICTGEPLSQWPVWAKKAAEAARIAPSAMNRQPWIFRYDGHNLIVETAGADNGRYSKRLDCGIALRHLLVGAQEVLGHTVSVEFYTAPLVAGLSITTS
ncbi:MAG: nitroreductase family protein [Spirochaetia bacterium]